MGPLVGTIEGFYCKAYGIQPDGTAKFKDSKKGGAIKEAHLSFTKQEGIGLKSTHASWLTTMAGILQQATVLISRPKAAHQLGKLAAQAKDMLAWQPPPTKGKGQALAAAHRAAWARQLTKIAQLTQDQLVLMQAQAVKAARVSLSRHIATQRRAFATWIAQSPGMAPPTIFKLLKLPPRHDDELMA